MVKTLAAPSKYFQGADILKDLHQYGEEYKENGD